MAAFEARLRITQLDSVFYALRQTGADSCLIAGDFNFADNTVETTHLQANFPGIGMEISYA